MNAVPEHWKGEKDMNDFSNFASTSANTLEIISRQTAEDKFDRLNRQARLVRLWNLLTGRPRTLMSFGPRRTQFNGGTCQNRGVQDIPVRAIVGSVGRAGEYDRQFRPLNPALRNRWIGVHVLAENAGWEPVVVHKVGEVYFVEDGHHRVSVARHSGYNFIEAQVYEYTLPTHPGSETGEYFLQN
jgi:hypothetical protein